MRRVPSTSERPRELAALWLGVGIGLAGLPVGGTYLAATWERPHRALMLGLVAAIAALGPLVAAAPRDWLGHPRARIALVTAWSVADVGLLAALGALDGPASPFLGVLGVPLVYAALAYPTRSVAIVAAAGVAAYAGVWLLTDARRLSDPLIVTFGLVSIGALSVAQSYLLTRADRSLRASEARFRGGFEHAAAGMALVAPDGTWLRLNAAFCALLGQPEAALIGRPIMDVAHPDDRRRDTAALAAVVAGAQVPHHGPKRYVRPDGSVVAGQITASVVRDASGTAEHLILQFVDLTERQRAEERARRAADREAAVAALGRRALAEPDLAAFEAEVGQAVARVLGRPLPPVAGGTAAALSSAASDAPEEDRLFLGSVANVLSAARERAAVNERLVHQSLHDVLTGLPNRTLFLDRLTTALARARRRDARLAVLYMDLDGFKHVNDLWGHATGDELLRVLAPRLAGALRASDTLARFGGDEFLVLCEDVGPEEAADVAERLLAAAAEPVALAAGEHHVAASIGIALAGPGAPCPTDAEGLVRDADTAMYRAKAAGGRRWEVFGETMRERVLERGRVEAGLRRALEQGELRLAYQPQVDLATGAPYGVEALLRWEHPERGVIAPGAFIGVAEETGLIVPVGAWVLEAACRQAVAWRAAGGPVAALRVSVNVSALQLARPTFADEVAAILATTGAEPYSVCLELTESAVLADADAARAVLEALRELGVGLSLDDFGTGYSSLRHLHELPITELKLDRSYVAGLGEGTQAGAVVEGVLGLARGLGLDVVAEGVEDEPQRARLEALGCPRAQGFLFARPGTAAQAAALAAAAPRPAAAPLLR